MKKENLNKLVNEIETVIEKSRNEIARKTNEEMLNCYWNIGRIIIEEEQKGKEKAQYGDLILKTLSEKLTLKYGRGFSLTNLKYMRLFYICVTKSQTFDQLSRSHYLQIITISNERERTFYINEIINKKLSVRELKREIKLLTFERTLIGKNENNYIGNNNEQLILKDPLVLDFLDINNIDLMLEKDLESAILLNIEKFLLELGTGFFFVSSQERLTVGSLNYYVDLVFYNKLLRCYVLIDLKMDSFKPENVGQMNFYLNYYKNYVNTDDDNDPIGIILCAKKDDVSVSLSLDGLKNNIYAGKFINVIPKKEELEARIDYLIDKRNEAYKLNEEETIIYELIKEGNKKRNDLENKTNFNKRKILRLINSLIDKNKIIKKGNNINTYYEIINKD